MVAYRFPKFLAGLRTGVRRFIYMSLIEGDTLLDRWDCLNEDEKRAVCGELNRLLQPLRSLEQGPHNIYIGMSKFKNQVAYLTIAIIGGVGNQPLNDIFVAWHPSLAEPFQGANAVEQLHDACGIKIDCKTPIVFTHDDLLPPNIVLSKGPSPKVAAIIDWAQAG